MEDEVRIIVLVTADYNRTKHEQTDKFMKALTEAIQWLIEDEQVDCTTIKRP